MDRHFTATPSRNYASNNQTLAPKCHRDQTFNRAMLPTLLICLFIASSAIAAKPAKSAKSTKDCNTLMAGPEAKTNDSNSQILPADLLAAILELESIETRGGDPIVISALRSEIDEKLETLKPKFHDDQEFERSLALAVADARANNREATANASAARKAQRTEESDVVRNYKLVHEINAEDLDPDLEQRTVETTALTSDGKTFVGAFGGRKLVSIDTGTGKPNWIREFEYNTQTATAHIDPTGKSFTLSQMKKFVIRDVETNRIVKQAGQGTFFSGFTADGKYMLRDEHDLIEIIEVRGKTKISLVGGKTPFGSRDDYFMNLIAHDISPNVKNAITVDRWEGPSEKVRILYHTFKPKGSKLVDFETKTLTAVKFMPDGKSAILLDAKGLHVLDLNKLTITKTLPFAKGDKKFNEFFISPDGKHLVGYKSGVPACIWNLQLEKEIIRLEARSSNDSNPQFSGDGRFVLVSTSSSALQVWNLDSRTAVFSMRASGNRFIEKINFSQDGNQIVVVVDNGHNADIQVWKAAAD